MMKYWLLILGVVIFSASTPGTLRAAEFKLAVAANTIDTVISEVIVKKAYEMLGHQVEIIRLPPKRALIKSNSGDYDGDVQRIYSVADTYPNLIRLEPSINYIHGAGFVLKGSRIDVNSWQDLGEYRVGIILGIRFAETNVPKESAIVFNGYQAMTEALLLGKVDIAIYPQSNGIYQALINGMEGIVPLKSPLARFELYHYVHKSNSLLVEKLQTIFRQFKDDELLEKVRVHVLKVSFDRAKQGKQPCFGDYACYQSVWDN